jgi:hypothetical protein
MSEHTRLQKPPQSCPNDGICANIIPRIEECEDRENRHEKALERMGAILDTVQKEVHEIRVVLRERDKTQDFLRTVFLTLLGCFGAGSIAVVIQVFITVHYFGSMTEKIERVVRIVDDHEVRLRSNERDINKKSP